MRQVGLEWPEVLFGPNRGEKKSGTLSVGTRSIPMMASPTFLQDFQHNFAHTITQIFFLNRDFCSHSPCAIQYFTFGNK